MEDKILKILQEQANISKSELADRLGTDLDNVENIIAELEAGGHILGYTAIVNDDHPSRKTSVRALIEVKVTPKREGGFDKIATRISRFPEVSNVYLMSGGYDLSLEVNGESLQEVAAFVATKLSTIDGVISCATHFILKKYKEAGFCYQEEPKYERLSVTP